MIIKTASNETPFWRILSMLLLAAALWGAPNRAQAQLYVGSFFSVGEYDASNGTPINSNLVTSGISLPYGMVISGGNLYVTDGNNDTVDEYDATSGALIQAGFITGLSATGPPAFGRRFLRAQPGWQRREPA